MNISNTHGEPAIDGGLNSMDSPIIGDWFTIGEMNPAVTDACAARADIVFCDAALPDAVAFLVAEGASISALAGAEK